MVGQANKKENDEDKGQPSLFDRYEALLKKNPLLINTIQGLIVHSFHHSIIPIFSYNSSRYSGAIITACSVVASQWIDYHRNDSSVDFAIDYTEIRVAVTVNVVLITPLLLFFFSQVLSRITSDSGGLILKLFIDQLLFSPVLTFLIIALRFSLTYSAEEYGGDPLRMSNAVLTMLPGVLKMLPGVMTTSWAFWVPARILMLNYCPTRYMLLTTSIASFMWNIIFNIMMRKT